VLERNLTERGLRANEVPHEQPDGRVVRAGCPEASDPRASAWWNSSVPFLGAAVLLGLVQAWMTRFYMGNDGVPYLDMADAYLRGDWHTALNGYWNPLYAWLIGLDFLILRPSPYWEHAAVQLLNLGIYVLTVAAFEYFVRGLLAGKRRDEVVAVRVIAYVLFLWSSLILIRVWTVNADMLVAACFYFALGLLLRAHSTKTTTVPASVMLGITLAAGYYCKAVMFPLSLGLLFVASIVLPRRRALVAALVFCLLSAPLIAGVSKAAGHLTFGDTGKLNYAWYVNGVAFRCWQGGPVQAGQPEHPPRIALDSPRVYEFGGVFPNVTYPIWYDSSYWYQGLRTWIDPRLLATEMRSNLKGFVKLVALQAGGFLLGWGICFLLYRNKLGVLQDLALTWPAWLASIGAILLYSAVHIEPRHIAAFATVLLLTAYSAIHVLDKRIVGGVAATALLWALLFSSNTTARASTYVPWYSTPTNDSWQVAASLQELGLYPEDKVASVCYSNRANVIWARLARVHIVAETDWNVDFWRLSDADQGRVLGALAHTGALIAVSDEPPPNPARAVGWLQVGNSRYYAHSLSQLRF